MPTSRTIYLLKRVEILLRNGLESALRTTGISVAQYVVLSVLENMTDASSAKLSRRAGVTPQTMSETVTAFEKAGLIARTQSCEHKRILTIRLTPLGLAKLAECETHVDRLETSLLAGLDETRIGELRKTLREILAAGSVWETKDKGVEV